MSKPSRVYKPSYKFKKREKRLKSMNVRVLTWNKTRVPKEEELRAMMEKEGMKPYISVMEKNEFVDAHEHNYDETRILVSGKVEFCAEGRSHVLKPGARIDLKPVSNALCDKRQNSGD